MTYPKIGTRDRGDHENASSHSRSGQAAGPMDPRLDGMGLGRCGSDAACPTPSRSSPAAFVPEYMSRNIKILRGIKTLMLLGSFSGIRPKQKAEGMDKTDTEGEMHPSKRAKENTPPPEEETWSSAVFIPVKSEPVDIPPQRVEEPVRGAPNESYLEEVMGSDKVMTKVSPSSTGQEKQVPENVEVGNRVEQRIRLILQRNRPIAVRIQAPNLVLRLTFVLGLLARPGVMLDSLCLPVNLHNAIELDLRRIHGQIIDNKRIPEYDTELYMLYKGFVHLRNITKVMRVLAGKRYKSLHKDDELHVTHAWHTIHPHYCPICHTLHPTSLRDHPENCAKLLTNGPRRIADLKYDTTWQLNAKAIVLGSNGLLYLPPVLKATYVNLGSCEFYDYAVPTSASQIFTECTTHESSLMHRLEKVIGTVGRGSHLPILVEFYENPHYPNSNINLHLSGFAHAIRHAQHLYMGPIVMVIGPVMASANETESSYQHKKGALAYVQKAAFFIGHALGVPVAYIPMQVTEMLNSGERMWYHFWRPEALFSDCGTTTREFSHRLFVWLELYMKYVYDDLPKPYGVPTLYQLKNQGKVPLPHFVTGTE